MQVLLSILPFKEYKFLVQILPIIFTVFSILKEQVLALKLEILSYDVAWVEIAIEPSSTIMRLYLGRSKRRDPHEVRILVTLTT